MFRQDAQALYGERIGSVHGLLKVPPEIPNHPMFWETGRFMDHAMAYGNGTVQTELHFASARLEWETPGRNRIILPARSAAKMDFYGPLLHFFWHEE